MLKNCTVIGKRDGMMGYNEVLSKTDFRKEVAKDTHTVYVNLSSNMIHCKICKEKEAVNVEGIIEIFAQVKGFKEKHKMCGK